MNLYFLVEGSTEGQFYPIFTDYYFEGKISRVDEYDHAAANTNNYYLISTNGYPYIYTGSSQADSTTALKSAIQEVNANPVYNYLIVCLDADDERIDEKIAEFNKYVAQYALDGVVLNSLCELEIVVQNRCIETWFLGNRKMYASNPNDEKLIAYSRYYNVKKDDPELMGRYLPEYTHQDFHLQYLRAMLREKRKTYNKSNISATIGQSSYIQQLEKRSAAKEHHLKSFADFVSFCKTVKDKL